MKNIIITLIAMILLSSCHQGYHEEEAIIYSSTEDSVKNTVVITKDRFVIVPDTVFKTIEKGIPKRTARSVLGIQEDTMLPPEIGTKTRDTYAVPCLTKDIPFIGERRVETQIVFSGDYVKKISEETSPVIHRWYHWGLFLSLLFFLIAVTAHDLRLLIRRNDQKKSWLAKDADGRTEKRAKIMDVIFIVAFSISLLPIVMGLISRIVENSPSVISRADGTVYAIFAVILSSALVVMLTYALIKFLLGSLLAAALYPLGKGLKHWHRWSLKHRKNLLDRPHLGSGGEDEGDGPAKNHKNNQKKERSNT